MVTTREAEILATKAVREYLEACAPDTEDDIANTLMKLCSVAGVTMAAVVGAPDAVERLKGTAAFVERAALLAAAAPPPAH